LILDALFACAEHLSQKGEWEGAQRLAACVLSHPTADREAKERVRALLPSNPPADSESEDPRQLAQRLLASFPVEPESDLG